MPTPLTPEQKALRAARTGLEKIKDLHAQYKDSVGLTFCALCFKNWPCETHKFAEGALTKMKGQLSRQA